MNDYKKNRGFIDNPAPSHLASTPAIRALVAECAYLTTCDVSQYLKEFSLALVDIDLFLIR
jgi:hypothetical protein